MPESSGKNPLSIPETEDLSMVGKTVVILDAYMGTPGKQGIPGRQLIQPGIITRLLVNHGDRFYCNVKVFVDCGDIYDATGIMIYKYQIQAEDPEQNTHPDYCGWLA